MVKRLADPEQELWPVRAIASLVAGSYPWVSVYWVFSVVALASLLILSLIRLPELQLTEEERTGSIAGCLSVFRNRHANYFALGVFAYVACEQVNSNWLSQFLKDYHGLAPETGRGRWPSSVFRSWAYSFRSCGQLWLHSRSTPFLYITAR